MVFTLILYIPGGNMLSVLGAMPTSLMIQYIECLGFSLIPQHVQTRMKNSLYMLLYKAMNIVKIHNNFIINSFHFV